MKKQNRKSKQKSKKPDYTEILNEIIFWLGGPQQMSAGQGKSRRQLFLIKH